MAKEIHTMWSETFAYPYHNARAANICKVLRALQIVCQKIDVLDSQISKVQEDMENFKYLKAEKRFEKDSQFDKST